MASSDNRLDHLPLEILERIVDYLSKHDLSVCVRVSKSLHRMLIDRLWHTVEVDDQTSFHRFKDAHASISTTHNGSQPLSMHIHRIRVLKILFHSTLDLILTVSSNNNHEPNHGPLSQHPIGKNQLPFQELYLNFFEDPPAPEYMDAEAASREIQNGMFRPSQRFTDIDSICELLTRSDRLVKLTIRLEFVRYRDPGETQAKIWMALPSSLEHLFINDRFNNKQTIRPPGSWMSEQDRAHMRKHVKRLLSKSSGPIEPLSHLSTLAIVRQPGFDMGVLLLILDYRDALASLEDLHLINLFESTMTDACLSELLLKKRRLGDHQQPSSRVTKGWKTLGFQNLGYRDVPAIGPLSVAAILEQRNCDTLENLRIGGNFPAFTSAIIQQLLCTAPRLKRFDTIHGEHKHRVNPPMLQACDIIQSPLSWACLGLESFKCWIGGIPRPEVQIRTNNVLLKSPLHDPNRYSMEQSQCMQKAVLAQLGRLTQLRDITLGQDTVRAKDWEDADDSGSDDETVGERLRTNQLTFQYACLSMRLKDGLDKLVNLKRMRRLHLLSMAHLLGDLERQWMRNSWPDYGVKDRKDKFWTDGGHSVNLGETHLSYLHHMHLPLSEYTDFDWW